jgi:predicted MPP superfamily phosphohydrolase
LSLTAYALGFWNARFRVEKPKIEIPIADLPQNLKGLKIVQLSDMHLGTGPDHLLIKKVVEETLSLHPDLIVLTGDIFDGMIAELDLEIAHLKRLQAPHGVYFVLGNHECYWNWQECVTKVKELGFIPLLNEGVDLKIQGESVFVAGLTDPASAHVGGEAPKVPIPPLHSKFNLMLVHQPQLATRVASEPYHLQLSGHTHGGQFFPWNLAVKKIYPISGGLGKEKNLWVYVSHGSGYWGPPIRLGTLGEVTQLTLA